MSTTLAELAARAILDLAARPGMSEHRVYARDLHGLQLADLHAALLVHPTAQIDVRTDDKPVPLQAVLTTAGTHLVPYLVGPSGHNSGERGFSATLRTYGLEVAPGEPLRTLLVLDREPLDTVSSAATDASSYQELSWNGLVRRALTGAAEEAGLSEHPYRDAAEHFARYSDPSAASMDAWVRWATLSVSASATDAGSLLWTTGAFMADPQAFTGGAAPWEKSAGIRRNLQRWHESMALSFSDQVAREFGRIAPSDVLRELQNASGAFELDASAVSVRDLIGRPAPADPLDLHADRAAAGATAFLRGNGVAVLWAPRAAARISLPLSRRCGDGDKINLSIGGVLLEESAVIGLDSFEFTLSPVTETTWSFGTVVFTTGSGRTRRRIAADLAVFRHDGAWMPIEDRLQIDGSLGAFLVPGEPRLYAVGPDGQTLSEATAKYDDEPGIAVDALVSAPGFADAVAIPLVIEGEPDDEPDEDDDPERAGDTPGGGSKGGGPDEEPGGDDDPRTPGGTQSGTGEPTLVRTIPHALFQVAGTWPTTAPDPRLPFAVGSARFKLEAELDGKVDLWAIESLILDHPEWLAYSWVPGSTPLREGIAPPALSSEAFSDAAISAFADARAKYFAAAKSAGSCYLLDPRGDEASAYLSAFDDLLNEVDGEGPYRSEYDALLRSDAVKVADQPGVVIAPTNPLAVAYHRALAEQAAAWAADDDFPSSHDIASMTLRHVVPVLYADDWLESVTCDAALWRRYVSPDAEVAGEPDRNRSFIAMRLRFFLDVHPEYKNPEQTLAVSFREPPDAKTIIDALLAFYKDEEAREEWTLPQVNLTIYGGPRDISRQVSAELAGVGRPERIRQRLPVVQSRVTVTCRDGREAPAFSHVAFLMSTGGSREPHAVDMTTRLATTYLDGLAAGPGRRATIGASLTFQSGTWAPEPRPPLGTYLARVTRSLEIVGGQPHHRLNHGWTQMPSTEVKASELAQVYDHAVWVVHLDRLLGIEAFGHGAGADRLELIDYEDRADPSQPGFDGITATRQIAPYNAALARALGNHGPPTADGLDLVLKALNGVSGRWALELLHENENDIRERIGTVVAITALNDLDEAIGGREGGTVVLIALDEILGRKRQAGLRKPWLPLATPEGRMCDDLLMLWVPDPSADEIVLLRGGPVEVKFSDTGVPDPDVAASEVHRTAKWFKEAYDPDGASRPFRARDLAELLFAAHARATTFALGQPASAGFNDALRQIASGGYEIDMRWWRGAEERRGLAITVEGGSTAPVTQAPPAGTGAPVDLIRLARPALRGLLTGQFPPRPETWAPLRFEPPPGEPATPETVPPADPPEQSDATPAQGEPEGGGLGSTEFSGTARVTDDEVRALAFKMDAALQKYRLPCEPCDPAAAQIGPSVVRLRTRTIGALSIATIEAKARDLGREVGAESPVIVTQEPHYICIDVPRAVPEIVRYAALAGQGARENRPGSLGFIAGVAPSGQVRTADLARLPHLLVAGATASGKSVFLRAMLCELLRDRGPEQLKLMIIDPKQVDFAGYASLPHLEDGRIITDPLDAVQKLTGVIERELAWRQPRLLEAGAMNVTELYEHGTPTEEYPQMVILVDEFADLAGALDRQPRQQFLASVQRYAQLTRAFGIYLVLATQRPSTDVITGTIKANLTARVAMSLPSHTDSMTIIDRAGAEDLLGNGDMLFYRNGQVERLQGVYADATDVRDAVSRWHRAEGTG